MPFEHKAYTWQWGLPLQRVVGLCGETNLALSGLGPVKQRAKLVLLLKDYGQRAHYVP